MTTTWEPATLAAIAAADDLHIAPFRPDGETTGTPTWIWSVAVGDGLYVRAWNGQRSRWYQAAIAQGAGKIRAAGTDHDVTFEQAPESVQEDIDAAYEAKYHGSSYLPPMLGAGPVSATVKVSPR
jgi:hypothetical protein